MSRLIAHKKLLLPFGLGRGRARLWFAGLLSIAVLLAVEPAVAAKMEILTPAPGARILARNPMTHLVLRAKSRVIKDIYIKSGAKLLKPVVSSEGDELVYLHFELPLKSGKNRFTLMPGAQKLEYHYERIQSDLAFKQSRIKNASFFHVGEGLASACLECHNDKQKDAFRGGGLNNPEGCVRCHANIPAQGVWQHSMTMTDKCLSCHLISRKPWKIGFPVVKTQELCFSCHVSKKLWLAKKNIHGPIVIGGCTLCHNPHGSEYRYQLWAEGSLEICILCHSDKGNLVAAGKGALAYPHGIISGAGCVACHDAHATDHLYMLKKPINELCTGCHPQVISKTAGHPVANHPVSAPEERRRPNRPLSCTSCHNPHGSSNEFLLIQTKLGGRLCRVCHKR